MDSRDSPGPDLRPHARAWSHRPEPKDAPRWTDNPFSVFGLLVAVILASAAMIWIYIEARTWHELAQYEKALELQAAQPALNTPEIRRVTHRPQSVEDCRRETRGVINEQFQRCRQGWVEYVRIR